MEKYDDYIRKCVLKHAIKNLNLIRTALNDIMSFLLNGSFNYYVAILMMF